MSVFSIAPIDEIKIRKHLMYSEVRVLAEPGFFPNIGQGKNDFSGDEKAGFIYYIL